MSAVRFVGRTFCPPYVLASIIAALSAAPAIAGQWSAPVYTYSGTTSWTTLLQDGTTAIESSDWSAYGPSSVPADPGVEASAGWGEDAVVDMAGTATATFTWIPDPNNPNDNPPKSVVVEVQADASADGQEGSADDGLGDPGVQSVSGEEEPLPPDEWFSDGSHCVRVGGSSGTIQVHVDLVALADNTASNDVAQSEGAAYFSAYIPNLNLDLIRDGAHDESVDSDGNIHGDTTYSYIFEETTGDEVDTNWQTFHPVFGDDWDLSLLTWIWNPNESQDTETTGRWSIPFGNLNFQGFGYSPTGWFGTPDPPVTKTITYDATEDSMYDGNIDLQATYYLTFHDEVEGLTDTQSNVVAIGPLWGSGGSSGTIEGITNTELPERTIDSNTVPVTESTGYTNGYSIGGDINLPLWVKVFGISFGGSYQHSASTSYSGGYPCPFDVPYNEYAYAEYSTQYVRHTFHWRHFDAGGEHILHNADGSVRRHTDVEDQADISSIQWKGPFPMSVHGPTYDGTVPSPPAPDPSD